MIIAVDIGNTAAKIAAVVDDAVVEKRSVSTRGLRADALSAEMSALVTSGGEPLDAVAVTSVVPEATAAVIAPAGAKRIVVSAGMPLPIQLAVREPDTVGTDRICAAVGAVDAGHRNAIVVDIGTAITVDRVHDLRFVGGAIMPGPRAMLRALARDTGRLPDLDLESLPTLFPELAHPTAVAMALGVGLAARGGILGAVARLSDGKRGSALPVVVTGGDAVRLRGHLPPSWREDLDLTLVGLARIARHALDA